MKTSSYVKAAKDMVRRESQDGQKGQESFDLKRKELMTQDEMKRIDDYLSTLYHNEGSMSSYYTEWEDIEEKFSNCQPEESDMPNTRANIMVSTIEGMITQTVDKQINTVTQGVGPEDEHFANSARVGLNWIFKSNSITDRAATFIRRRFKFGVAWFKVVFDDEYAGGFGLSKIQAVPIDRIYIDGKITDDDRIQEAEYICEIIDCSRSYAEVVYGKEKASAIQYGYNEFHSSEAFDKDFPIPDGDRLWALIQWWSRQDGKLRLEEFSACGVLLYDSHKEGNRRDNQRQMAESIKSYYKYVSDEYPYFLTVKYPKEGHLYGFGDGWLLLSIQKLVNELYDKIRIQARPNLVMVDIFSDVDVKSFDDNSYSPTPFDGARLNNRPPVISVPWGTVNKDMYELLERIRVEMQRIVRYSDLMMGQSKSADTATEAAIQQQQGNSHIDWEKGVLERILAKVGKYCINLMMEFSKTGKSLRIGEDNEEYKWVDFRNFASIPVQKPATKGFQDKYKDENPGVPIPKYEGVEEDGKPVTKNLDLDLTINVGSGLPKNPAFLWSMIEKLSQMFVVDTDEEPPVPKPAINFKEIRKFLKDYLGIPIKSDEQMKKFVEEFKKMQLQMMKKKMGQSGMSPGGFTGDQATTPMPGNAEVMGPGGPGGNQPAEQPGTAGMTVSGGAPADQMNNPANVGGLRNG
jgi:hypothetical protein